MREPGFPRLILVVVTVGCADAPDPAPQTPEVASGAEILSIGNAVYPKLLTKNEQRRYMQHMQMTPRRTGTRGDSLRAAAIVDSIERTIRKWKKPEAAIAAGFVAFDLESPQDEYHFLRENFSVRGGRLDYERPSGLVFKKDTRGNFYLVGAMYATPGTLSKAALDSLIPTSHSQWHRHVNWCFPPLNRQDRWAERNRDGDLIFGIIGVTTKKECDRARGLFRPDLGGWMMHAMVYERNVWGGHQMGANLH